MTSAVPGTLAAFLCLFTLAVNVSGAMAQETTAQQPAATTKPEPKATEIRIGYLRAYAPQLALSVLDVPPRDEGVAGAEVAIGDNNTTGAFLGQKFTLDVTEVKPDAEIVTAFNEMATRGDRYVLADISAKQLLSIADIARANGMLIFNVGATDDILREEECRANSSIRRRHGPCWQTGWRNIWSGSSGANGSWSMARTSPTSFLPMLYAARRPASAARSSLKRSSRIPERPAAPIQASSRSSDRCLCSRRICPSTTFCWSPTKVRCSELMCHSAPGSPRPVAGTAGLIPSARHPASEQWGGTQIQNRFAKANGRRMLSKDMAAWTAIRILGEAATRTPGADPAKIEAFIRADDFSIAAFKGQKLTFRTWNWQLRQPIFLGDGRSVVSTSPRKGSCTSFQNWTRWGSMSRRPNALLSRSETNLGGVVYGKTTDIPGRRRCGSSRPPRRPTSRTRNACSRV